MQKRNAELVAVLGLLVLCIGCGDSPNGSEEDVDSAVLDLDSDEDVDRDSDLEMNTDPDGGDDTDANQSSEVDSEVETDSESTAVTWYQSGDLPVEVVQVAKGEGESPRPVRLTAPVESGTYPIVFFFHGFLCVTSWYDTITAHLASHGFIVAAIQTMDRMSLLTKVPEETERAVETIAWLKTNLDHLIEATPDLEKIAYAGHSRGGKIAWNIVRTEPDLVVSAIAGVDPVDGRGIPEGTDIEVIKKPLAYDMPSLVIGTGLGPVVKSLIACAPKKDGHLHFWENVPSPAYHVVVEPFGHMEMFDDDVDCGMTCSSCAASQSGDRESFRKQIGGSLVGFFESVLKGKSSLAKAITDEALAPTLISAESK